MRGRRSRGDKPLRLCITNPFGYELFDQRARASHVFGGAEVQLHYLATALTTDPRFEVVMVVERPRGRDVREVADGVRMISVEPAPSTDRWRDRVPLPSARYLRALLAADADVYLQRGGAVLTGDVALAARLRRRQFVFMAAHDWDCTRDHVAGSQWLAGRYYLNGLSRADLVIAQSRHQQELLREHHGVDSRVMLSAYPPMAGVTRPREHVLWIGRCVEWKRPMELLDLAEALPHRRFVMISPRYEGSEALHAAVEHRAHALPNVDFIEFVPFTATERFFARALALVNTSVAEGFPNTFVQAARCGTPVASLDVNTDGIIDTFGIGVYGEGDPTLLARRLDALISDPAAWNRAGRNAAAYFADHHDLTKIAPTLAGELLALRGG